MGAEIRDLNLWGDFDDDLIEIVKQAKDALGVEWFVRATRAAPGCEGNVLATEPPTFYVDGGIAVLTPPYTVDRMVRALRQVFELDEPKNLMQPADWLSWAGLPGCVEITEEDE